MIRNTNIAIIEENSDDRSLFIRRGSRIIDSAPLRASVATMAARVGIDAVIGPLISEGDERVTDGAVKTVVAYETGLDAA